jgi:hypothetical protein
MAIEWRQPENTPTKTTQNSISTKDLLICFRYIDDESPNDYQITSGKYNFRMGTFKYHCRAGKAATEVIAWAEINYPESNNQQK